MAADGSIVVKAEIDDKQAQAELNRLTKKIDDLKGRISQASAEKIPLVEEAERLEVALDAAKAKLYEMETAGQGRYISEQIAEQKETVKSLQYQWEQAIKKAEQYERSIEKASCSLAAAESRAGALSAQLVQTGEDGAEAGDKISASMKRVEKHTNRAGGYLKRMLLRRAVYMLLATAMQAIGTWFSVVTQMNTEMGDSFSRLKGAFLTFIQPISSALIPVLTVLANVLTRVLTVIAALFSYLGGSTLKQSIESAKAFDAQAKGLKNTGKAAKSAAKSLASFDEINQLAQQSAGGGGGANSGLEPKYDFEDVDDSLLQKILSLTEAIGAALLAWKLSDNFLGGLRMFLGLFIAIHGVELLAKAVWDMFVNGVTNANLGKALAGIILLAGGLAIAFGVTGAAIGLLVGGILILIASIKDIMKNGLNLKNGLAVLIGVLSVAAGVGMLAHASLLSILSGALLVVGGLAVLVLAVQDAIKNGWNLQNTLVALAGIILTGLGISILVGTWIPALIAGIIGILFAITALTGNGESLINGLKQVFSGLIQFVKGVFTGDWKTAWEGVKNIFKGIWNSIITILESAINLIVRGINWVVSQANKLSFTAPSWIPVVGGKTVGVNLKYLNEAHLPRLAQGAVIPPNREFMAVLGDQTSGNNIEAPEGLIRSIVQGEMSPLVALLQELIEVEREGKVIKVDNRELGRTARAAMRSLSVGGY